MYFNYYNLNLRKSILSQLQYCNIKLKINYKTDLKLILETNIWYQTNIITSNKLCEQDSEMGSTILLLPLITQNLYFAQLNVEKNTKFQIH